MMMSRQIRAQPATHTSPAYVGTSDLPGEVAAQEQQLEAQLGADREEQRA